MNGKFTSVALALAVGLAGAAGADGSGQLRPGPGGESCATNRNLRDFIEFLPSCKRHYVDNPKLNARDWDRAWTIRDERFNAVTNLFLDIERPETFPRELFDSASSAGAVRGCFGWGKGALDPRFATDIEPCTPPDEKPPKLGVKRAGREDDSVLTDRIRRDFNREQIAELDDQCAGRLRPYGGAVQVDAPELLVRAGETPFELICRRVAAALDAREKKGEDVSGFRRELVRLRAIRFKLAPGSCLPELMACDLRRRVLFSDPALAKTGPLAFLARATYAGSRLTNWQNSDATGGHFATQCYAFNTIRGGGLFTVDGWKDAKPVVRNLLEGCVVTNGPLAGKALDFGCFYSFDFDYDGRTLFFTHARPKLHRWIWDESTTWKIYRLDLATGRIAQLTFGNTNDFDPCVLPSGRVLFSSERRGGFIRCFTKDANLRVPVFMMHSMKPDGRDIYPISYYETSEWQMSVDNDGLVVYTRWDYTDRDDCLGSHFWICYPDGRDPRAPHGNYPYPWHTYADNRHGNHQYGCKTCGASAYPMTEMGIRAIPGSKKYILTAAPHHGESFGSICRLDLSVRDDGGMSQLRRMTPYVPFPESECKARSQYQYGTPWPVDENLYFCTRWEDVVLRDRFGNEELVVAREHLPCGYDPRLRLTHARPTAPRVRPRVVLQQTAQGEDRRHLKRRAVISVVDVRKGDLPFPTNRVPTRLRVLQAIVKPDPWMDMPFIGYEAENCPRIPLGTVPVEDDGSCHFYAPAGKQLIFQVLDADGAAIQTMRSTAFVHPGEYLSCVGCHEPRHETVKSARLPKAMARPPSELEPEGIGVEPITFARLVRPVLARTVEKLVFPDGVGPTNLTYQGLRDWTFHFNGGFGGSVMKRDTGGSRSIPGRVGAAACKLGQALLAPVNKARIPEADRRRLTLWLDANSPYYGAFYDFETQRKGDKVVWPILDVDPDDPLADCE